MRSRSSPFFKRLRLLSQRLSTRLVLLFLVIVTSSMLAFIYHTATNELRKHNENVEHQARVLADNLTATGSDLVLTKDYTSLERLLLRSASFRDIRRITISDKNGKIISDVTHKNNQKPTVVYSNRTIELPSDRQTHYKTKNNQLLILKPLILGDLIGWVQLEYSLETITREAEEVFQNSAATGLAIILVSICCLIFFLRKPIRSINSYTEFADKLEQCKGEHVPVNHEFLELNRLGLSLNRASSRIHEQNQIIEKSITELERVAAFAENSPIFVLSLNHNAEILYSNLTCHQFLNEEKLDSNSLYQLLPNNIIEIVSINMNSEIPVPEEEVSQFGRTLHWRFAPVKGQDIMNAYGIDVTESRKAQHDFQFAIIEKLTAEEANKAKSQFLANMSHELRTPLNAIIGYTEILAEDAVENQENEQTKDLGNVSYAAQHLLSLIEDVLDLSKIEVGKMDICAEEFMLQNLLDEVIAVFTPLAEKNNNKLLINGAENVIIMYSDLTKVKQILFNLLNNATKFTNNGKIVMDIESRRTQKRRNIIFKISDTGIGMSEDQRLKIFEPFTQADNSTTRQFDGTSLGLSITKHFCELLEGKIELSSEENHGSTFTVTLPLRCALNKPTNELNDENNNILRLPSHKSA